MTDGTTQINIQIEEQVLLALSKIAHSLDITLNELISDTLTECVEQQDIGQHCGLGCDGCICNEDGDEIDADAEEANNERVVQELSQSVLDMLEIGVSQETLIAYGYAFDAWNNEYIGDLSPAEIITDAFDQFEENNNS